MGTVEVQYWVLALVAVLALTALGHFVGSRYQEPRNNSGWVPGLILGLLVVTAFGLLKAGYPGLATGATVVAGAWLITALIGMGALR